MRQRIAAPPDPVTAIASVETAAAPGRPLHRFAQASRSA